MSNSFATVQNVIDLWRPLTTSEQSRVTALLPVVEDLLRQQAKAVGKNLDTMVDDGEVLPNVVMSVVVDVVARAIMTPTDEAPTTQFSQSALGYSVSGSYLVPGGGIFIKKGELARLGLNRQKVRAVELC